MLYYIRLDKNFINALIPSQTEARSQPNHHFLFHAVPSPPSSFVIDLQSAMPVKTSSEGPFAGEPPCIDTLDDSTGDDNLGRLPGVGGASVKGGRGRSEDLSRE